MKVIRSYIKYLLICPLVIAFSIVTPVEASESFQENIEEVDETKIYHEQKQSINQKPKNQADEASPLHDLLECKISDPSWLPTQLPKYILYCNLIFYE